MAECDLCKEWFHSTCVKLPDDINESEWICPNCMMVHHDMLLDKIDAPVCTVVSFCILLISKDFKL